MARSKIGVKVEWRLVESHHAGCLKKPMHRSILMAFSWHTDEHVYAGALAFANPHSTAGACVTVFMDRLEPLAVHSPLTAGFLVGHVLAHETAHILQGILRHSETGVLKVEWSPMEIDSMRKKPLEFTEYDEGLILQCLRAPR